MITLPEMPPSIAKLPRDERGYPVPWFVAWRDGKPEFRMADGRKFVQAVNEKRCWVCGETLDPGRHVFVVGPMCAITRTHSEPPSHPQCGVFSMKACPFLSRPHAKRRTAGMEGGEVAGVSHDHNPGVAGLWYCRGFKVFDDGNGRALFTVPNPSKVVWYCEGRLATRPEILEGFDSAIAILKEEARNDADLDYLNQAVNFALRYVPGSPN